MSIQDSGSTGKAGVKTLAIRLEPETHAQLSLIAQLRGHTITDEIKAAVDAHIAGVKQTPELAARAGSVLEDIEREALARRTAIATLVRRRPAGTGDRRRRQYRSCGTRPGSSPTGSRTERPQPWTPGRQQRRWISGEGELAL